MATVDFLGRAIELAKKAIEEDGKENYEEAYKQYQNALEYFVMAIKYEKNDRLKEAIRKKCTEYLERAELLKDHLTKVEKSKQEVHPSNDTGATKGKKKGSGDDDDDADSKKLRAGLTGAILTEKPNIHWDDVAGLEGAKEALKEAVILPIKFPQLFTGKCAFLLMYSIIALHEVLGKAMNSLGLDPPPLYILDTTKGNRRVS
ncbi:Vacuolar protein sorting-associated protein 4 [Dispira parvispora]|uniref:vesicle-fusing ATPase n=1 Tax=Dispira parvispora TaxID=1520584 RepID=A0A9W8E5I4_9FUNG|nr:Vacuolar protein sorting-associated protein 4 [Dispira parvispora]